MTDMNRKNNQEEFLTWEAAVELRDKLVTNFNARCENGQHGNYHYGTNSEENLSRAADAEAAARTAEQIINLGRYVKEQRLKPKTPANG